jgi:hypothetical protein
VDFADNVIHQELKLKLKLKQEAAEWILYIASGAEAAMEQLGAAKGSKRDASTALCLEEEELKTLKEEEEKQLEDEELEEEEEEVKTPLRVEAMGYVGDRARKKSWYKHLYGGQLPTCFVVLGEDVSEVSAQLARLGGSYNYSLRRPSDDKRVPGYIFECDREEEISLAVDGMKFMTRKELRTAEAEAKEELAAGKGPLCEPIHVTHKRLKMEREARKKELYGDGEYMLDRLRGTL